MTRNALSDDAIVAASLTEPARFGELFDRHFSAVLAYARRRVGYGPADEVTSETFTRAFRHRDRYRGQGHGALPWLLGIASNIIRGHRRDERRHLKGIVEWAEQPGSAAGDPADRHLGRSVPQAIADAVRALPARQREVILLHAWADLTPDEIAQALAIPAGSVRSHLSRARATLARSIAQAESHAPDEGASPT